MSVIENAVTWALAIAKDPNHGYDQSSRWGPNYDCSSLVISAFEQAGVPVKTNGATYTGNMKAIFLKNGFTDVTNKVNLSTGSGLVRGDVCLHESKHVVLCISASQIVHASINEKGTVTGGVTGDQTGKEICTRSYYNKPWGVILRYTASSSSTSADPSASNVSVTSTKKVAVAQSFGRSIAGTYKIVAVGGLNMRYTSGVLTSDNIICNIPNGSKVQCYGYYTMVSGTKWYYISYNGAVGFVSSKYLQK